MPGGHSIRLDYRKSPFHSILNFLIARAKNIPHPASRHTIFSVQLHATRIRRPLHTHSRCDKNVLSNINASPRTCTPKPTRHLYATWLPHKKPRPASSLAGRGCFGTNITRFATLSPQHPFAAGTAAKLQYSREVFPLSPAAKLPYLFLYGIYHAATSSRL